MGKKRVKEQKIEETIKEAESLKSILKKEEDKTISKKLIGKKGNIYISATYNNIRVSATDEKGNMIAWSTSGNLKFKGPKKATPFAASQVANNLLQKISKSGISEFNVFVRGYGGGRESALRTLIAKDLNIIKFKDITPIRHGGCRPPRARRV
jgi:small subunit ribosomal protein S11